MTNVTITTTVTRQAQAIEEPPPNIHNLYRLRHDFETPPVLLPRSLDRVNYPHLSSDKGYPEMIRTYEESRCILTEAWQRYWYALLGNPSLSAWQGLTHSGRFLTNDFGTDQYHDYISRRNVDKADPKIESLGCGGNVVQVIDGDEDSTFSRWDDRYGMRIYWAKIRCLDGSKPPPSLASTNYATKPWLVHIATNSTPFPMADGRYLVNPFPQLGGRNVYFPLVSKGGFNWVEERRLERLPNGIIPSVYVP